MTKFQKFQNWASELKNQPKTLKFLIFLNILWGAIGIVVDWPWLMSVPTYLTPLTPICSIYPPLLTVWYLLYFFKKRPPAWFTAFIFIGCLSYGVLAQIYYPMYMSWIGFNLHDAGSMIWVAVYGLQSFVIASELRPLKSYQMALIISYFALKDYSDYVFKTFIDFLREGYPEWIRTVMLISCLTIQIIAVALVWYLGQKNSRKNTTPKTQINSSKV